MRKKLVGVLEDIKMSGGSVHIFSNAHVSGKKLETMGAIAAILRFPVWGLDEE